MAYIWPTLPRRPNSTPICRSLSMRGPAFPKPSRRGSWRWSRHVAGERNKRLAFSPRSEASPPRLGSLLPLPFPSKTPHRGGAFSPGFRNALEAGSPGKPIGAGLPIIRADGIEGGALEGRLPQRPGTLEGGTPRRLERAGAKAVSRSPTAGRFGDCLKASHWEAQSSAMLPNGSASEGGRIALE